MDLLDPLIWSYGGNLRLPLTHFKIKSEPSASKGLSNSVFICKNYRRKQKDDSYFQCYNVGEMFFSVKLYNIINLHFLLLAKIVCVICVIVEYHPATHYLTKVKSSSPFHVAAVRLWWWSKLGIEDICNFLHPNDLFDMSQC